jgi:hypothetical protein
MNYCVGGIGLAADSAEGQTHVAESDRALKDDDADLILKATFLRRLEPPTVEIGVHLVVSLLSVLSIAAINVVFHWVGLDGKTLPGTPLLCKFLGIEGPITLDDWMLWLEIIGATVVIGTGIESARKALART